MKTHSLLPVVLLAHFSAMSAGVGGPLPPETRQSVTEWRAANLPAADTASYWASLRELGSRIGEDQARAIGESGASDIDSAVAWMAFQVWQAPQKVDELAAWYGRRVDEIPLETWNEMTARLEAQGLSREEVHRALAHGWNPSKRYQAPVIPLIVAQHGKPEYLAAWQGWIMVFGNERVMMGGRIKEALVHFGDHRSITLLLEKIRLVSATVRHGGDQERVSRPVIEEIYLWMGCFKAIGGENGVRALLSALRLVEEAGFGGEGVDGFRAGVVRMLSSRTKLEEELRDPNSKVVTNLRELGKPIDNPDDIGPADDKWKQFKPIIQGMLGKPEGLRPEDVAILREALAAMPKE